MTTCSIPACLSSVVGRNLCRAHYLRWYLTGDVKADIPIQPRQKPKRKESFEERFWKKVDQSAGQESCWPWIGARGRGGYGQVAGWHYPGGDQKNIIAHRAAYILTYGPIPEGFEVDHTCHTRTCLLGEKCPHRQCCNPAHLEAVPQCINWQRGRGGIYKSLMTHCHRGHPFTTENTYNNGYNPNGTMKRACKRCRDLRINNNIHIT
jgi:hypothetical protein